MILYAVPREVVNKYNTFGSDPTNSYKIQRLVNQVVATWLGAVCFQSNSGNNLKLQSNDYLLISTCCKISCLLLGTCNLFQCTDVLINTNYVDAFCFTWVPAVSAGTLK